MSQNYPIDLQNPADVARETFRQLASQRIAPTPEAYREIYQQITGSANKMTAERMLTQFAASLNSMPFDLSNFAKQLEKSLVQGDWASYGSTLKRILNLIKQQKTNQNKPLLRPRQLPQGAQGASRSDIESLSVRQRSSPNAVEAIPAEEIRLRILRELLDRSLSYALSALLQDSPELAEESKSLANSTQEAFTEDALNEVSVRLKQLCFKIELKISDIAEQHELMRRLFQLLLDSVNDVVDEETLQATKLNDAQEIFAQPISHNALKSATRDLKEVVFQQGLLKKSLADALRSRENMLDVNKDLQSAQQQIYSLEAELERMRMQLAKAENSRVSIEVSSQ